MFRCYRIKKKRLTAKKHGVESFKRTYARSFSTIMAVLNIIQHGTFRYVVCH